jgi:hypothetical protein
LISSDFRPLAPPRDHQFLFHRARIAHEDCAHNLLLGLCGCYGDDSFCIGDDPSAAFTAARASPCRWAPDRIRPNRRGKRLAAVIDPEDLDRLIELAEDAIDIAEARAALEEEGPSIPWEEVKADLGL